MQGKRSWYVVRKHLMAAAHEIETKGVRLADILLIPEPFSLDDAAAIAKRRTRAMAVLLSPGEDVQFKLMLVMSELKEFSATDIDYRIVLRHMPDCPLYMERKAGERFKRVFECEYEAWAHQRSADQAGPADPWRQRFLFCGLIYAKREGVYFVDIATLVMLSSTWIPLDHPYEHLLIDELVRQERRFLKPLRGVSERGAARHRRRRDAAGYRHAVYVRPRSSDEAAGRRQARFNGMVVEHGLRRGGSAATAAGLQSPSGERAFGRVTGQSRCGRMPNRGAPRMSGWWMPETVLARRCDVDIVDRRC
jgi:Protein of unknown function (DUF1173)